MAHFLLIYDRDTGRLVRQERYGSSAEAMQARFAAEREFAGQEQVEVVALTAESEEALRRTHGRYFLTLAELADRLR
ncbi:hypothetical protein [Conexibacter woesei]|uniref:hypothetical protein n=1 Tax=Conexibacter woesei TaxID=191495 RepID=UPI0004189CE0|nr:hypothetical protein [Conexibacter woesei]